MKARIDIALRAELCRAEPDHPIGEELSLNEPEPLDASQPDIDLMRRSTPFAAASRPTGSMGAALMLERNPP